MLIVIISTCEAETENLRPRQQQTALWWFEAKQLPLEDYIMCKTGLTQ